MASAEAKAATDPLDRGNALINLRDEQGQVGDVYAHQISPG